MDATEIQIKCNCENIETINLADENLNWEIVETDEREMGVERLHEAVFEHECDSCATLITIILRVWEYPEGFYNMDEIEVDGGNLVKGCSLGDFVL